MSFFVKEYFNLPAGYFQEGVTTALAANGTVFQDGTYGYINTYANADGAMMYSDAITKAEFFSKPIKFGISYQIAALTASDYMTIVQVVQSATVPVPGALNYQFGVFIYNNAGIYQEKWSYYNQAGTNYQYDGMAHAWIASGQVVRTINLNTTYTVTVTWSPVTKAFSISHDGAESATTGVVRSGINDYYWLSGDTDIASYYGQAKYIYFKVEDVSARNRFTLINCFTSAYKKSPFFTSINNLTTRTRDSFTFKNSILDHTPYRSNLTFLNNIGVEGQLIYLDGSWQTVNIKGKQLSNRATVEIDGLDVSSKVNDWSIDYDDQTVCKTISVTVKDRAYAQSIQTRKYSDSAFDTYRIEVKDVDGYSLGKFLIENKSENAAHKTYSCTLSGRSLTALLDIPYSERLQTLNTTATGKYIVVSALATAKSLTTTWDIPDATLPIGALAADDESPISLIKKIVEAGGGLVYTNRSDYLVCAYKDYETTGKSSVMSLSSGDIVSISQSRTVPNGENQVTVEGYTDTSITSGWAQIGIEASKYKLKSNGYDSCTITATCRNEDLTIPTVELQTDEEQTPSSNDHYEISVSKMIDTDGAGVVSIVKESDSSVVAGPYEVIDARTIRATTAMADETYLVTYWGGETVTFSVDNYADISPTEVLVRNGRAQATLRASAGGGGYATVSADYLDAQTAKLTVTIADPRVGSIDVSADPSSVSIGETSTVKIQVLDSDGYPADNGLYVDITVIGYGQLIDYAGVLTPTTATTTTESITDGGIENGQYNPIYPVSEIEVSTQYQISAITSIYRYEKGQPYKDVNYATGATVDGNTITLLTPLPSSVTPIQVTYDCTGIATSTFSYPSYRTVPKTSIQDLIVAQCGGEVGSCDITIESPYSSGSSGGGGGGGGLFGSGWVNFEILGTPAVNSTGSASDIEGVKDVYYNTEYLKANFQTDKAKWQATDGLGSFTWEEQRDSANRVTYLILTVQALQELPQDKKDTVKPPDSTGKTYVSGTRVVKDANSYTVIPNVYYSIAWGDDTETGYTNDLGILAFSKGQPGISGVVTLTKTGYTTKTASISIPGSTTNSNLTDDDADTSTTKWATLKVKVSVPYIRQTA
jgi:hypothetical protein